MANAESSPTPKNYEAILSLEFKDAVRITDLSKALKKDVGDQKNVDIISTNTKLDFEGKIQTFTRSNEEQLGTQNFFDSQKKNQSAFLQTIVNLKEKSESGKTVENKEAVAPLLNKYTKQELKKTTAKYKNQTVGVNMVILGGTLANMNKIKSGATAKLATKSELTNVLELQKQSNEIKAKIENATTPEAKQEVISKELAKVMCNISSILYISRLEF